MAKLVDLKLPPPRRRLFSFTRNAQDGSVVDCKVLIQILTGRELDQARAEAVHYVKRRLAVEEEKNSSFEELLIDARIYEVLQYALRDPEQAEAANPQPWCTSMELREILTNVEIGLLWRAYLDHEADLGPIKHSLTPDEYEGMLHIAAQGEIDPHEFYAGKLRRACHQSMASEIFLLRNRVEELNGKLTPADDASDASDDAPPYVADT